MDSVTERMLERARARQRKLEEHHSNTNDSHKLPLQEPNVLLKKYENSCNITKSQPNLTECYKMKRKEAVSDTCLNTKSAFYDSPLKENLSDSNISKKGCTRVSSDLQSSPQQPTKTLNIQKENFNMEIKLTSADNVRVEVEIEERDESYTEDDQADEITTTVSGIRRINTDETNEKSTIREDVKNRLHRLGQLYSDDCELSSPIHRTESKFCQEDISETDVKKSDVSGIGRLKALANTMNQWEDEISTTSHKISTTQEAPKKSWKPPAPKPSTSGTASSFTHTPKKRAAPKPPTVVNGSSVNTKVTATTPSRETSPEKSKLSSQQNSPIKERSARVDPPSVALDNAVLATLESQGFTRTNSNTRLIYNYNKNSEEFEQDSEDDDAELETKKISRLNVNIQEEKIEEEEEPTDSTILKIVAQQKKNVEKIHTKEKQSEPISRSPNKSDLRSGDVLNRAAMFEKCSTKVLDPALMSVSERKALFEKNKGAALVPQAAFGMAAPIKHAHTEKELTTSMTSINNAQRPASPKAVKNSITKPTSPRKLTTIVPTAKQPSPSKSTSSIISPTKAFIAESGGIASKMRALLEKKSTISQSQIANNIKEQRKKDLDMLLNRFHKQKDDENEEIVQDAEESSDDESVSETTKMLSNRNPKVVQFKEKILPPPPVPQTSVNKLGAPKRRSKGDSSKVREVLEDVKRIKVSPPKSGRIYPCLSDIEASTETEHESAAATPSPDSSYEDICSNADSAEPDTSFGREILEVVCKNQTPQKRTIPQDCNTSDLSDILDGMDDYLDEALECEDSDCTEGPTPPKHVRSTSPRNVPAPSNSFHYSNGSPSKYYSPSKQTTMSPKLPEKSQHANEYCTPKTSMELPTHVMDGENILPLTHTVSFYRKQQAQGSHTPLRQITRQPAVQEESPEKEVHDDSEVQEKIQDLMNTVSKQQTVISQASQALNLCCSTIEFSGSSEQVEAERLLLVATQRRHAALHEVQRLRVERTLHAGDGDKGTLIISDIALPLKKEYVRALSASGGKGHHIVCLVRYAEYVLPTKLVSTIASSRDAPEMYLRVPGSVKLENIFSDFTITVEVYSLQAQEELLPHEVKYHISTKKGGSKLTPKKFLKHDSKLMMPTIQSPAGPQAVRSSSFSLMGYVVFSLQAINRTHWALNNAPALSPLDGTVQMRVSCELAVSVEHRGFLTMFEDVSGFGAWHRRWCLLKGHNLSYWKYPDDERKKAPIDSINLQICSTKKVGQVSREICARPHTFLLETVRTAKPSDKESLVTVYRGENTIIKYLLSADTKEERLEWCEKFNKVLETMRLWGNHSK